MYMSAGLVGTSFMSCEALGTSHMYGKAMGTSYMSIGASGWSYIAAGVSGTSYMSAGTLRTLYMSTGTSGTSCPTGVPGTRNLVHVWWGIRNHVCVSLGGHLEPWDPFMLVLGDLTCSLPHHWTVEHPHPFDHRLGNQRIQPTISLSWFHHFIDFFQIK